MPYHLEFNSVLRRATLLADADVDLSASMDILAALTVDPRLEPGYAVLVDMRQADYTPSLADARKLTELKEYAERLRSHPIAFVTATPAHYSAASLVATMASLRGVKARAFQQHDEALNWLAGQQDPA
ncbi:MAG TPA: hypothetical protein VLL51_04690 [Gemmatimonadales bacterium]|nr:hypothetical protein [Gemmatimonadales bacterium]